GDRVLLGLQAVDGLAHRLLVVLVHHVGRTGRIVQRQGDDAVGVFIPLDRVLCHRFSGLSDSLDDGGHAHAAADAQRDQRAARTPPLELVDHGSGDHRAGGAQRVAHRDGATVDVEFLVGDVGSFWNFSTTEANASFNSNRSMSSTVRPARSSTFLVAGVGPVSMMTGSAPLVAVATIRARGVRPCDSPAFSLPMSTSAAPSTMPEELPPVWTWLI